MEPLVAEVMAKLNREAAATPGIVAAYLFGSLARGRANARDIDVALLWAAELAPAERWTRGEALAFHVESALRPHGLPLDLVDLRQAPPSLQQRVLAEGMRLFESDPVARIRFESMALSMAIDFLEWQRPYLDRWLARVSHGR